MKEQCSSYFTLYILFFHLISSSYLSFINWYFLGNLPDVVLLLPEHLSFADICWYHRNINGLPLFLSLKSSSYFPYFITRYTFSLYQVASLQIHLSHSSWLPPWNAPILNPHHQLISFPRSSALQLRHLCIPYETFLYLIFLLSSLLSQLPICPSLHTPFFTCF